MRKVLAWAYSGTVGLIIVAIVVGYVSGKYGSGESTPREWLQLFSLTGGVPLAFMFDSSNKTSLHAGRSFLIVFGLVALYPVLLLVILYVFVGDGSWFQLALGGDTGQTIFERMRRSEPALRYIELGVVGLFVLMDREA
ncbi:MAG: hypothetical protein ACT4N2_10935 [Hyphomicrobium sp.]